ncbi:flagellar basal body P-ring formation chaperone FlgA [Limnohabitans sp.]|uniref:flagellar basal body P-ring formation chaperone FlgA n=1 Tax=Limnohabitans sp. TaxID=1907725 RepID=UPI00333F8EC5
MLSLSLLAASPGPSPQAVLQKSVVEWVVKEQAVSPDAVILAPLDPRMQVKACDKPLAMDLPFGSYEKLRVRCSQPTWQIYVRVSVQARNASKGPSPGPSTPTVSASGAETKASAVPEKRQVLVASMPLYKGQFLNESHVRLAEVESKGLNGQVLESVAQVMHAELIRDVRADAPLRSQDIRPMVLVKRGQMVLISVGQAQGFQISARVEALQDGRFGDQIKLKNKESGRILTGQVKGPNLVEGL